MKQSELENASDGELLHALKQHGCIFVVPARIGNDPNCVRIGITSKDNPNEIIHELRGLGFSGTLKVLLSKTENEPTYEKAAQ